MLQEMLEGFFTKINCISVDLDHDPIGINISITIPQNPHAIGAPNYTKLSLEFQ